MELYVDLGAHSYSIYIENNILKDTGSYIEKVYSGKKIMIISDDNVFPLYGDTIVKTLEDEYEVQRIQPVDMFPFSKHVECVAVMCIK